MIFYEILLFLRGFFVAHRIHEEKDCTLAILCIENHNAIWIKVEKNLFLPNYVKLSSAQNWSVPISKKRNESNVNDGQTNNRHYRSILLEQT